MRCVWVDLNNIVRFFLIDLSTWPLAFMALSDLLNHRKITKKDVVFQRVLVFSK